MGNNCFKCITSGNTTIFAFATPTRFFRDNITTDSPQTDLGARYRPAQKWGHSDTSAKRFNFSENDTSPGEETTGVSVTQGTASNEECPRLKAMRTEEACRQEKERLQRAREALEEERRRLEEVQAHEARRQKEERLRQAQEQRQREVMERRSAEERRHHEAAQAQEARRLEEERLRRAQNQLEAEQRRLVEERRRLETTQAQEARRQEEERVWRAH